MNPFSLVTRWKEDRTIPTIADTEGVNDILCEDCKVLHTIIVEATIRKYTRRILLIAILGALILSRWYL